MMVDSLDSTMTSWIIFSQDVRKDKLMTEEDFKQDSDIDILGITKMDTESKPSVNKNDVFTESVSPAIAALVNSEAMQDIFG